MVRLTSLLGRNEHPDEGIEVLVYRSSGNKLMVSVNVDGVGCVARVSAPLDCTGSDIVGNVDGEVARVQPMIGRRLS